MRIMRTTILDLRELWEGVVAMIYVQEAIRYRVDDLTSMSALYVLVILAHWPDGSTQPTFLIRS